MNELWRMLDDPDTDPVLLRVYRWLLQWPEAHAFATMLDPAEVARATGLSADAIDGALRELAESGRLTIHETRADGVMWFTLALNVATVLERRPALIVERTPKPPREQTRAITLNLRWAILERDGHKCRSCGATVDDGARLEIDHIKPFSKGGLTTPGNLQVLCYDCNAGKRDRWIELA
jgi:hypothetical protein